ncbi:hypothetical protein MMC34_000714 [Xylographa carneopallida]|nr:hypothetical protein [Xylographa carneopallida]
MALRSKPEYTIERESAKRHAAYFLSTYPELLKVRNNLIHLEKYSEVNECISKMDSSWGARSHRNIIDLETMREIRPTFYFKCLLVLEDFETAREFFQELSKAILECFEITSITTQQSTLVHNPHEGLQVLQQLTDYEPYGNISYVAFTVKKLQERAQGTRRFRITQSEMKSNFEPGFESFSEFEASLPLLRKARLLLTVRLDIPGRSECDVNDIAAWLRNRDSLNSKRSLSASQFSPTSTT